METSHYNNSRLGIKLFLLTTFAFIGCTASSTVNEGQKMANPKLVNSYEECVAAGNIILKSYPPRCTTPDGLVFIEGVIGSISDNSTTGICIDHCGDGECQEVVCLGSNCPCSETIDNCPEDCK